MPPSSDNPAGRRGRAPTHPGAGSADEAGRGPGTSTSQAGAAYIRDGRSGVLRLPESARTLVVYAGAQETARLPLALDPGRRTLVEP